MQWGDSDAEKEVARLQKVKLSLEADLVNEKGKVIQLEETKKEQSLTIKDHLQYSETERARAVLAENSLQKKTEECKLLQVQKANADQETLQLKAQLKQEAAEIKRLNFDIEINASRSEDTISKLTEAKKGLEKRVHLLTLKASEATTVQSELPKPNRFGFAPKPTASTTSGIPRPPSSLGVRPPSSIGIARPPSSLSNHSNLPVLASQQLNGKRRRSSSFSTSTTSSTSIVQVERELAETKSQLEGQTKEIIVLKGKLASKDRDLIKVENELMALTKVKAEEIRELKDRLDDMEYEIEARNGELENLKESNQELEKSHENLEKLRMALVKVEKERDEIAVKRESESKVLENELTILEQEKDDLVKEVKDLGGRLEDTLKEIEEIEGLKSRSEETELSKKLEETEARLRDVQAEVLDLGSLVEEQQVMVENVNEENATLVTERDALGVELTSLTLQVAELDGRPTIGDLDTVREALEEKTVELERLKEEVLELSSRSGNKNEGVSVDEEGVKNLEKEVELGAARIEELEAKVSELIGALEEQQALVKTLSEEKVSLSTDAHSLVAQEASLHAEISWLTTEIASLKLQADYRTAEIADLSTRPTVSDLNVLQDSLTEAAEDKDRLESEIGDLRTRLEDTQLVNGLEEDVEAGRVRIGELEALVVELESLLEEQQLVVKTVTEEKLTLITESETLLNERDSTQVEASFLKLQLGSQTTEIASHAVKLADAISSHSLELSSRPSVAQFESLEKRFAEATTRAATDLQEVENLHLFHREAAEKRAASLEQTILLIQTETELVNEASYADTLIIDRLSETLRQKEEEANNLETRLIEEVEGRIVEVESLKLQAKEKIALLESSMSQYGALEAYLSFKSTELESLRQSSEAATAVAFEEKGELLTRVVQLEEEKDALVVDHEDHLMECTAALQDARSTLGQLEHAKEETLQQIAKLTADVTRANHDIRSLEEELDRVHAANVELVSPSSPGPVDVRPGVLVTRLRGERDALRERLDFATTESEFRIGFLQQQLSEVAGAKRVLELECSRLEVAARLERTDRQKFEERALTLENNLRSVDDEADRVGEDLLRAHAETDSLRSDLSRVEGKLDALEHDALSYYERMSIVSAALQISDSATIELELSLPDTAWASVQVSSSSAHRSRLERRVIELQERVTRRTQKLAEREGTIVELSAKLQLAESLITGDDEDTAEIPTSTTTRELETALARREEELLESKERASEFEAHILSLQATTNETSCRVVELDSLLQTSETDLVNSRATICRLEDALISTTTQATANADVLRAQITELSETLEVLERERNEGKEILEEESRAAKQAAGSLESLLLLRETDLEELRSEADRLIKSLTGELSHEREKSSALELGAAAIHARLTELETDFSRAKQKNEEEVVALQDASNTLRSELSTAQRTQTELESHATILQSSLETTLADYASAQSRAEDNAAEMIRLEIDLNAENARVSELESLVLELRDGDRRTQVENLELQLATTMESLKRAEGELNSATLGAQELDTSLQSVSNELSFTREELHRTTAARDEAVNQMMVLSATVDELGITLSTQRQLAQDQMAELIQDISRLEDDKAETEEELASADARAQTATAEVVRLETKLQEEATNVAALESSLLSLREREVERENVSKELELQLLDAVESLEKVEDELSLTTSRVRELESSLQSTSSTQAELERVTEELTSALSRVAELESSLHSKSFDLSSAQEMLRSTKEETAALMTSLDQLQTNLSAAVAQQEAAEVEAQAMASNVVEARNKLVLVEESLQAEIAAVIKAKVASEERASREIQTLRSLAKKSAEEVESFKANWGALEEVAREAESQRIELTQAKVALETRLREVEATSSRNLTEVLDQLELVEGEKGDAEQQISHLKHQVIELDLALSNANAVSSASAEATERIQELEKHLDSKAAECEEAEDRYIEVLRAQKRYLGQIDRLKVKIEILTRELASFRAASLTAPAPTLPSLSPFTLTSASPSETKNVAPSNPLSPSLVETLAPSVIGVSPVQKKRARPVEFDPVPSAQVPPRAVVATVSRSTPSREKAVALVAGKENLAVARPARSRSPSKHAVTEAKTDGLVPLKPAGPSAPQKREALGRVAQNGAPQLASAALLGADSSRVEELRARLAGMRGRRT